MPILRRTTWLAFVLTTVVLTAITLHLNRLSIEIDTKTQEVKKVGVELQEQTNKHQEEIIKETQRQIDELKAKVEAKKAEEARIASQSVSKPLPGISVAQAGSCHDWMVQAGVTDLNNAYTLIMRESGCRPTAHNTSSGAYGIPQSLPASKIAHCGNDPVCQIQWMQNYVVNRYGSWANAVAHSNSVGWY